MGAESQDIGEAGGFQFRRSHAKGPDILDPTPSPPPASPPTFQPPAIPPLNLSLSLNLPLTLADFVNSLLGSLEGAKFFRSDHGTTERGQNHIDLADRHRSRCNNF